MLKNIVDLVYSDKENEKLILELVDESLYVQILDFICKELNFDYSLVLDIEWVDKNTAINLNKDFRDEDYNPDVLSFPINDQFYNQTKNRYLGDLILNYSEMAYKTKSNKNTLFNEAMWCIVHGVLHLLGYDHEQDDQLKIMFDLTNKILSHFKINYNL